MHKLLKRKKLWSLLDQRISDPPSRSGRGLVINTQVDGHLCSGPDSWIHGPSRGFCLSGPVKGRELCLSQPWLREHGDIAGTKVLALDLGYEFLKMLL